MIFDLNPLEVLNSRKLTTVPPHFSKMKISDTEYFEGIEDWVRVKLKGRYAIYKIPSYDQSSNNLKTSVHIAFEEPSELTYFILACPQLRRN
jgi:hypothetical protein